MKLRLKFESLEDIPKFDVGQKLEVSSVNRNNLDEGFVEIETNWGEFLIPIEAKE